MLRAMREGAASVEDRVGTTAAAGVNEDAVRVIAERLSGQLEEIARRMVERYREEIVDYKLADPEFLDHDVYEVSLDALRRTVADLESRRRPSSAGEFEVTRQGAARRVHQGVSLESFLHAARLWVRVLWEHVLLCSDESVPAEREAALEIAGGLLEHVDLISSAAAQGYLEELQAVWTDREVVRRDLLDALVSGEGESEQVRRLATSLRLSLRENYIVIIVHADERPSEEEDHEQSQVKRVALRRIVEVARARLKPTAGSLLVGMRHGEVISLYPFDEPGEFNAAKRSCCELARALDSHATFVGISSCHEGLGKLAISYGEAREAVEIAVATRARGRLVAFDDVLIDSLVRSSKHAGRLLDDTIAPLLAYDRERQAELVHTLRAYVDAGFNLTKSADSLCVHPNTVVYRLRRIKELSGRIRTAPRICSSCSWG